jgi:hypothetical protein|uniref:Uncharacterized protein n=1 Tax=Mus musculus TaxID=10090 RepID=Q8HWA7_MOUSE|nr:unnamed protein product [Mus musculus]BAE42969.1 unnamed protein product [Mus musculus]
MGCLYSRPCPPSKASTVRDDGDSEEKEAQVLFEAVMSGCELAGSSPTEAGTPDHPTSLFLTGCSQGKVQRSEIRWCSSNRSLDPRITQCVHHPDKRWLTPVLPTV